MTSVPQFKVLTEEEAESLSKRGRHSVYAPAVLATKDGPVFVPYNGNNPITVRTSLVSAARTLGISLSTSVSRDESGIIIRATKKDQP